MKASVKKEWEAIKRKRMSWYDISEVLRLSEDFIREFKDKLQWILICRNQTLSEEFILEHKEYLDRWDIWHDIFKYQKVSEGFIRKLQKCNCVKNNWEVISEYQELSERFILRFRNRVCWYDIVKAQNVSKEFLEKYYDKYQRVYKSDAEKLEEVKDYAAKHGLEFDGEYLYAFRVHDRFGRGVWNKTIFYDKVGKKYSDWHCDMDKCRENSFGLGIWPKNNDVNVVVKVHYKDWGCAVLTANGKGRVKAFTFLGGISQWKKSKKGVKK